MILLCSLNENDIRTTWRNTIFTIIPISGAFLPCNEFKSSLTSVDFFLLILVLKHLATPLVWKKPYLPRDQKLKTHFLFLSWYSLVHYRTVLWKVFWPPTQWTRWNQNAYEALTVTDQPSSFSNLCQIRRYVLYT